jgi:hypothetical protein
MENAAKTCNTCHIPKPVTEFRKNFRYSDGRDGRCKECLTKRTAELSEKKVISAEYFDPKSQPF